MYVDFKPGDLVRGKINPNYHMPNRPYFDAIEMKGGGDAVSAARAVLQTGEYDFAWNMQVEDELLKRLEDGGKGHVQIFDSGNIEHIELNNTDPNKDVDGERSSTKTTHPFLGDPAVRQAFNVLVDRASVEKFIYGRTGKATANFINNPDRFVSKNTKFEFNVAKAAELLDKAGWKPGGDGIRAKDGIRLKVGFQTSINAPRQKTQEIVKQACQKAGIEVEIKAVPASVFFSSDVGNPDTYTKFYTDIQMFTTTMTQPDPGDFMRQFQSVEAASKENKWQGRNITRWKSTEYDKLYEDASHETDPVKRAALFIQMNDLVIKNIVVIPVVYRPSVAAVSNKLHVRLSGWDSYIWDLPNWYADA
jgi:peptide/nickel transport system substrate-binding protein